MMLLLLWWLLLLCSSNGICSIVVSVISLAVGIIVSGLGRWYSLMDVVVAIHDDDDDDVDVAVTVVVVVVRLVPVIICQADLVSSLFFVSVTLAG